MKFDKYYLDSVKAIFQEKGDPETAQGQMKYMRYQFEYYGLKMPAWMALAKQQYKEKGIAREEELRHFVSLCMEDDHREIHYFGIEMAQRAQKKEDATFIDFLEKLITTKSWWDTVDWLSKMVGEHFRKYPEHTKPVTERWMASGNIWLQRVCIIFQLKFKDQTDTRLMFDYMLRLSRSKEFFIQKGMGWALREYSKTDAEAVIDFIEHNDLPPLTKREGLKWLRNKGRV